LLTVALSHDCVFGRPGYPAACNICDSSIDGLGCTTAFTLCLQDHGGSKDLQDPRGAFLLAGASAEGGSSSSFSPQSPPQPSPHQRRRGPLCRGRWLYRRAWAGPGEHGGRRGGDADIWPAAAKSMQPRHLGRGELILNGIAVPVRGGAPYKCGVALAPVAASGPRPYRRGCLRRLPDPHPHRHQHQH